MGVRSSHSTQQSTACSKSENIISYKVIEDYGAITPLMAAISVQPEMLHVGQGTDDNSTLLMMTSLVLGRCWIIGARSSCSRPLSRAFCTPR
jgi:hypothetical protein